MSGEYIGFSAFAEGVLAKLNDAWPGFNLDIGKVVSNDTDVCVFMNVIAENLEANSMHHSVVKDGLEIEFNVYDDSQLMAAAIQIK